MKIDWEKPIISALRDVGVEIDQRMRTALSMIDSSEGRRCTDAHIFYALYLLNGISARHILISPQHVSLFQKDSAHREDVRIRQGVAGKL